MKLGFEESQTSYSSGSQSARSWTEQWIAKWAFCPNCGCSKIDQYPANRPVADFFCMSCKEEFELKSQKTKFGMKVVDGAFRTMCERLAAENNPNLILLNYDLKKLSVTDLLVVPKHFFVQDMIEERKPLAQTARRAGWVGCNILLGQIPSVGKIYIVRNGELQKKEDVLGEWQRTLFLRDQASEARGWLLEVMKCVELIGRKDFEPNDIYAFEERLRDLYPNNHNVKQKIRQQLQVLRDRGYLEFLARGKYRVRS